MISLEGSLISWYDARCPRLIAKLSLDTSEDFVKRFKDYWPYSIFTALKKFIACHFASRISWGIRIQGISENLFKRETLTRLISGSFHHKIPSKKLHCRILTGKYFLRIKQSRLQIMQTKGRRLSILRDEGRTSIAIDAKAKATMLLNAQIRRSFIIHTMKMPMNWTMLMKTTKLKSIRRALCSSKKIIPSIKLK